MFHRRYFIDKYFNVHTISKQVAYMLYILDYSIKQHVVPVFLPPHPFTKIRIQHLSVGPMLSFISKFCVCAPVTGSTKFMEWFTVKWLNPIELIPPYALHRSDITVVPVNNKFWMIGIKVAALLFGTNGIHKALPCLPADATKNPLLW